MGRIDTDEVHVEPSGWYAVQLRYAYLSADESDVDVVGEGGRRQTKLHQHSSRPWGGRCPALPIP